MTPKHMKDIGIMGLGVMGASLAQNLADKSYKVKVFNRTQSKTDALTSKSKNIEGHHSIEDLIKNLSRPRKIIIMVSAGDVVDKMLKKLDKYLNEEDIVVDGGNSDYKDTIRRVKEHKYGIVGCGISGGEEGARNGPSMMVGCRLEIYKVIGPILEEISCNYKGKSCCGWLGEDGAGHFVKLVHNGIEYCEMQLLQEIFNIRSVGRSREEGIETVCKLLMEWNEGDLEGYLIGICIKILKKKIEGEYGINMIVDDAEQKGTGKLCVVASIEAGEETVAMGESVMARFLSSKKKKRVEHAKMLGSNAKRTESKELKGEDLKKAFYLCKMISFVQGFSLMKTKGAEHGWGFEMEKICDIWRDGCILRSRFLEVMKEIVKNEEMELSTIFIDTVKEAQSSLERVCVYAVENGVYAPVFASCLMWLNGMKMSEMNGSLVQAMRDYFGRHGVVMKSGEATNINWDE